MARTHLRILSQTDVLSLLSNTPPSSLLTLMSRTFRTFSTVPGAAQVPHRTTVQTGAHSVLFMPARLEGLATAIKIVSVPSRGQRDGLPATTILLDEETGEAKAVVNARALTAVRTAAGRLRDTMLWKLTGICWIDGHDVSRSRTYFTTIQPTLTNFFFFFRLRHRNTPPLFPYFHPPSCLWVWGSSPRSR